MYCNNAVQHKETKMKLEFVLLTLLGDLWKDDARWQANVRENGVQRGYTLASEEDDYVTEKFASDELEFAEGKMYNFMGSEHEQESFYPRDDQLYKDKATGRIWAKWHDDIDVV
jgi:hypothetical protein